MNAAGAGQYLLGKCFEIGAPQLRQHAVLQNGCGKLVQRGEFFEHALIGRARRLRLLDDGEFELVEENGFELPRDGVPGRGIHDVT